ncbi:xylosyltransferase oxt-like isoform X2 [Artemia franciscana]|uniref:protein xylosyltransferase n=1 Tax=Artemia franciscana TaxID=6661 RepID=A0AA88H6Y2_ARTSF|nr:hypothetical protein QYM36_018252 [Artemia franciscana]
MGRTPIIHELAVVFICLLLRKWTVDIKPISDLPTKHFKAKPDHVFEEFPVEFKCNITSDVAKSALERARTSACKQKIVDFACSLESGEFIPTILPNTCPGDQQKPFIYIGCFMHNKTENILPYNSSFEDNSVTSCVNNCTLAGRTYAGVQNQECYCGDDALLLTNRSETSCNVLCPGNNSQTCGGNEAIGIYTTGFTARKEMYWISPAEGEDFGKTRIAFFLALNGRQIRQVKQLLRNIYSPDHIYLIHVDEKAHVLYSELLYLEEKYDNIFLERKRVRGTWGSPSLLHGILNGIKTLLELGEWDYWINLSESCFPLEYIGDLEDFLAANRGLSFLSSCQEDPFKSIKSQGFSQSFVECDDYLFRVGNKTLPKGIRMDFGSDWFVFHRLFAEFAVNDSDPLIHGLQTIANFSYLAPESYFHFATQNSHFCTRVANANMRIFNWKGKKIDGQCHCNKIVDACGCSPLAYRLEDDVNNTRERRADTHFARKFDARISQSVLTILEEDILDPYPPGTPGIYSYWEPIYLSKYNDETLFMQHAKDVSAILLQVHKIRLSHIEEIHSLYDKDAYQSLKVGDKYIKKEMVFENRALYIHPKSSIVLEHRWIPGKTNISAAFYFFNPDGRLVNISQVIVNNNTLVHSFDVKISDNMKAGEWSVLVTENNIIAGQLDFPVFPVEEESNSFDKGAPESSTFDDLPKTILTFLAKNKKLKFSSIGEMKNYLINRYYILEGVCSSEIESSCYFENLQICEKTSWSSLSPDPKSHF